MVTHFSADLCNGDGLRGILRIIREISKQMRGGKIKGGKQNPSPLPVDEKEHELDAIKCRCQLGLREMRRLGNGKLIHVTASVSKDLGKAEGKRRCTMSRTVSVNLKPIGLYRFVAPDVIREFEK